MRPTLFSVITLWELGKTSTISMPLFCFVFFQLTSDVISKQLTDLSVLNTDIQENGQAMKFKSLMQ